MAVHWADVLLVATPIRWGAASSLYYKMVERMNCMQNQITLNNKVLIRNKVAAFIVTGGQDGIQAVAGQMMGFFSEIGFLLPQFPFIAHSLGWEAEDMERNVSFVETSDALRQGRARSRGARGRDVALPDRAPHDDARDDREGRTQGVGLKARFRACDSCSRARSRSRIRRRPFVVSGCRRRSRVVRASGSGRRARATQS